MNLKDLHWLGHASFRLDVGSTKLYIDPWKISDQSPKADVILITHSHYDHLSGEDIKKITQENTTIVGPPDVTKTVKGKTVTVVPNKTYTVEEISIRTVPAYNIGKTFHPKKNNWVGYVLTLPDGTRVYHAGDTDAIPELNGLEADVALLPCGGTYTMSGEEAGRAASAMKVNTVVPMHWGDIVGSKADADSVKQIFPGNTVVYEPEQ